MTASPLLDALREELGCRSVKDGCSPQGQCGCCTVWVDGSARVACVTPLRRVAGRQVTTLEGLPAELRERWAAAFVAAGASQCGFCTPGIVLRLAALEGAPRRRPPTRRDVESALLAHLCRCTGWQSIVEAACSALGIDGAARPSAGDPAEPGAGLLAGPDRRTGLPDLGPDVVLGGGGFADDSAPPDALVQLGADATARRRACAPPGPGAGGAGPQQHGAADASGPAARGRVGAHPADHLGRAGLRRARRQLGRPGQPPRLPAGQRRRLRGQAAQPGPRPSPGSWPMPPALPSACCGAARTWCATGPSAHRWPSACGPTAPGVVRVGRTPGSADLDR